MLCVASLFPIRAVAKLTLSASLQPIVFDMVPSRFVRPGDLQQALWGPSAPDSPFHVRGLLTTSLGLRPDPFRAQASTFLCTVHGVGTLGHVRILGLPGAPSIITDKALVSTVQSSTVHTKCLTWCALIAEQLVLGATSTNDDAFHAALSAIRYAWRVGVAASSARGARDRLESERAAAQRGLLHALREMVSSERGDTVIRTWQHRFSDEVFVGKAVHWETTRLPHVATTAGLYEEYREVQLAIGHVLDVRTPVSGVDEAPRTGTDTHRPAAIRATSVPSPPPPHPMTLSETDTLLLCPPFVSTEQALCARRHKQPRGAADGHGR